MNKIDAEYLLIIICSVVILSYFFSIISRYIRVPSVLLLLFGGVFFRWFSDVNNMSITIPSQIVEALGVVGLIMIVLEAGLDLTLSRSKLKLIRDSLFFCVDHFYMFCGSYYSYSPLLAA